MILISVGRVKNKSYETDKNASIARNRKTVTPQGRKPKEKNPLPAEVARLQKEKQTRLSPFALKPDEQETVLDTLHSEKYQDQAPYQVYASLLDDGEYYCSIMTM